MVQHTNCGMHGLDEDALALRIEAAAGTPPNANVRFGAFTDLDTSVRASVARLRASSLLLHRDRIRGFVYDVETGRVARWGDRAGRRAAASGARRAGGSRSARLPAPPAHLR